MLPLRFALFLSAALTAYATDFSSRCSALANLQIENVTISNATYTPAGTNITEPEFCFVSINSVNVCRVNGAISTSPESTTRFEIWLPDEWYGRYLLGGSGALGGCFDYPLVDYGTTLHFATISSDSGLFNNLISGEQFFNHPETIIDYSYRGPHAAAVTGKEVVKAYYETPPAKSYYLGCSTGGRIAVRFALDYPDLFDGIVGGAPAVDWHHFFGWSGMLTTYVGEPLLNASDKYIPLNLWAVITKEILNQCDALDGLVDGLIADPDDCDFRPETLLCAADGSNAGECLTEVQVGVLHQVYSPLYGPQGELMWPRFDPGAEADMEVGYPMTGLFPPVAADLWKYTIYNDSSHTFDNFSISDILFADKINPGGIRTWDGDLSEFKKKGRKFLTYHGTRDGAMAHGNSRRFYEYVAETLHEKSLDDFYRLFWIPGMAHCVNGEGAWAIGQGTTVGVKTNPINDTSHNVLLALVDWVENDNAPEFIIGVDVNNTQRKHCKYPSKSHWDGDEWICI